MVGWFLIGVVIGALLVGTSFLVWLRAIRYDYWDLGHHAATALALEGASAPPVDDRLMPDDPRGRDQYQRWLDENSVT